MTNPTQRFFMVKVTGCKNCPSCDRHAGLCKEVDGTHKSEMAIHTNWDKLTKSCPMYPQDQTTIKELLND